MPWNHRFILTCTYVFRRRSDGNTYENLYLLSAAGTYCYRVFQTSADKSVYSVRFKREDISSPVIFAGVCMGYGMAMLTCGPDGGHVVFGAAIVTASLLGGIMKKPLAVTMLLFLCFPVKMFIWIFIAAAVGSKLITPQTRAGTFCKLQQAIESLPEKEPLYPENIISGQQL